MNEMFTEESRKAIEFARDEATRLKMDYIGTEHLLLGLLKLGTGKALTILQNLGVEAETLRQSIEEVLRASGTSGGVNLGQLPLTARAKKVLEKAGLEARALKSQGIDTEHLLLALAKDEEGIAAQVLGMFEIAYVDIYRSLLETGDEADIKKAARANWIDYPMTETVRDVIKQAQVHAAEYANEEVTISHLLFDIISRPDEPGTKALHALGVNIVELRERLESVLMEDGKAIVRIDVQHCKVTLQRPLGNRTVLPFSKACKKVFVDACSQVTAGQRPALDTTCILLAILSQPSCIPAKLIARYNVNYATFRECLIRSA